MNSDNFISIKPFDKEIRKYISYYYFHYSKDDLINKSIVYYPNYKNAITIYKHSKVTYKPNYSCASPSPSTDLSILYSGIQNHRRIAEIQAPFNKIGIVFQPLGLNHYLKDKLYQIRFKTDDMSFDHFGKAFIDACNSIYETTEIEDKVKLLDSYFKANYYGFEEEKLSEAVSIIESSDQKQTVNSLAKQLLINRRTLLRLFQKHLCCSVKEYINIVQFRKALDEYLVGDNDLKSLTELAYKYNFYDQSEFIKHVNKLTNDKPSSFFRNVKHLGSENTFWFIKQM